MESTSVLRSSIAVLLTDGKSSSYLVSRVPQERGLARETSLYRTKCARHGDGIHLGGVA